VVRKFGFLILRVQQPPSPKSSHLKVAELKKHKLKFIIMLTIKLFFFFLIQFQEARRAQICFYDKQLRPVSVEYFWIDTDDTKKDYEEKYMTHSIKQHQNFVGQFVIQ
jgi:hypothetical protein